MNDSERESLLSVAASLRNQAYLLEQLAALPAVRVEPGAKERCRRCYGVGIVRDTGDYCDCAMGRDLARVQRREIGAEGLDGPH